jgi:ectoine hydroxylase-related dioxygenase (phytanoyl-CoA dioxygenase family)
MRAAVKLPRLPLAATDALAAALDVDGCALVPGVLPDDLCARTRDAIDRLRPVHWDEAHDDPLRGARRLDRFLAVCDRDPAWLGFLDRPGIIELAEAVLGADCHVVGMTAWRTHPGYRGDALHVDFQRMTWPEDALPAKVRVPVFLFTAHFYLNDVTPALGPTCVIPGSHRAGREPRAGETSWRGHGPEAVLAHAGDCLVFRSDLWHGAGDNTTPDCIRHLLQVHYGRRAMAQHFVPFIDRRLDPAVRAAATPRQLRLLGDHAPGAYD